MAKSFEKKNADTDRDDELELARGMVEALTNNATVAFIVCDLQNKVIYVNGTFVTVFGWEQSEVLGMTLPIVREDDWAFFQKNLREHQWNVGQQEAVRKRKNGAVFSASETVTPIKDRGGSIISYACIIRDITARKMAERKLRESEQRFKSLFEQNSDATLSLDLNGRVTDANPAAQSMTGSSCTELMGRPLLEHIHPEERHRFEKHFREVRLAGVQHFDSALVDVRGNRVDLNVKLLPIVVDQEIVGIYCIAKDVTSHKQALEMINFMAFHDALTALPNRRQFQERLTEVMVSASSNGQRFGVFWIDLDGFKHINDTYGHAAGDYVLHEVGVKLKQSVGMKDTVARMGGDEFTILLCDAGGTDDIVRLAESLVQSLGMPISYNSQLLKVTPSIGIAVYPEDGEDVDTLLNHADKAMYLIKESGKNGYRLYGGS
ncbi:diguanylate cyclase domain-containing protein [Paenibacillus hamazuiensis]|uniref:diguanylate cyclase domain-containing protein n=1 Tax=Paenibacillus hamazuiensis TaxID=2936508 RepID=UPI00200CFEC3|nr:diguanylate cyclase [Paenibacillus hamazuiensis]